MTSLDAIRAAPESGKKIYWRFKGNKGWHISIVGISHNPDLLRLDGSSGHDMVSIDEIDWKPYYEPE
jgi:hypothetical protein